MKVVAFDVETRLTAAQVAEEYAGRLRSKSPWARPDLFGFAVGVAVDIETGAEWRFGEDDHPPREAWEMASNLAHSADVVVSYNGKAFDLEVLKGDIKEYVSGKNSAPLRAVRKKHVDLYVVVRDALDALSPDERLGSGGLDALLRANGLIVGKTGDGADAPALYAAGRIGELLDYCEADARGMAFLYRTALRTGRLRVEPYAKRGGEKVFLEPVEIPVSVPSEAGELASGTCELCDDGMPADELVRYAGATVCQTCAEEMEDGQA